MPSGTHSKLLTKYQNATTRQYNEPNKRIPLIPLEQSAGQTYLHGFFQGRQGLVQVSLCILSHGFTLQLFCPNFLIFITHRLNANTQM